VREQEEEEEEGDNQFPENLCAQVLVGL